MAGKGSAPRPIPNRAKFESNWDLAFGKKDKPVADKKKPVLDRTK